MDDALIVALYWERSEAAISETEKKYGNYCRSVAYRILASHEDAKECVNDTLLRAWQSMPPQKPSRLAVFLGKITRNLALDRVSFQHAKKRGGVLPILEELSEALPFSERQETITDTLALKDAINRFLASLKAETRRVFMRRYFYCSSVKEIAKDYGLTESAVSVLLHRTRKSFKAFLEKEGIFV